MDRLASHTSSPRHDPHPSNIQPDALVNYLIQTDSKAPAVFSGSFTGAPNRVPPMVDPALPRQSKKDDAADISISSSLPTLTKAETNGDQCTAAEPVKASGYNAGPSARIPLFTPLGATKETMARLKSGIYEDIDLINPRTPRDVGGGVFELVCANIPPTKMSESGMSTSDAGLRLSPPFGTLSVNLGQHKFLCKQISRPFQIGLSLLTAIDFHKSTLQPDSVSSSLRMILANTDPSYNNTHQQPPIVSSVMSGEESGTLAPKPSSPKKTDPLIPTSISDEDDLPPKSISSPYVAKISTVLTLADSPSQLAKGIPIPDLGLTQEIIPPFSIKRNKAPANASDKAVENNNVAVKGLVGNFDTTASKVAQESVSGRQPTGGTQGTDPFVKRAAGDQNPNLESKDQYTSPQSPRQSQAAAKAVGGAEGNDGVAETVHIKNAHVATPKSTQKSISGGRLARGARGRTIVVKRPAADRRPALELPEKPTSPVKEAEGPTPKRRKISPAQVLRRPSRKVNRDVNYNMEVHPQDGEIETMEVSEASVSKRNTQWHRSDDTNADQVKNKSDHEQENEFKGGASVIPGRVVSSLEQSRSLSAELSALAEGSTDAVKMGRDEDAGIAISRVALNSKPARHKKGGRQNPAISAKGRPKSRTNVPIDRTPKAKPEASRGCQTPSLSIAQPEIDDYRELFKLVPKSLSKLPRLADMIFTKHSRPGYISVRLFTGIFSCPRQKVFGLRSWTYFQPTDLPSGSSIVSCWAENGNEHTHIPIEAPYVGHHKYLEQNADESSKQVNNLVSTFDRCWPFSEAENRDEYVACAYFYLSHAARKKGASFDQYRIVWKKGLAESLEKLYKTAKRRHKIDNMPDTLFSDFGGTEREDFNGTDYWKLFPVREGGSTESSESEKELEIPSNNTRPRPRDSISSIADATLGRSSRGSPEDKARRNSSPLIRSSSPDIFPWKKHDHVEEPALTEEPLPTDPALLQKLRQETIEQIRMKLKRYQVLSAKIPGLAPLEERNQDDLQEMKELEEELNPQGQLHRLRVRLGVKYSQVLPWLGESKKAGRVFVKG